MADQRLHRNWSEIYETVSDHPWSGTDVVEKFWPDVESLNPQPRRVLDVGCGEGDKSRWFAEKGYEVIGIDFAPEAIATATKFSEGLAIEYHQLDIADLTALHLEPSSVGMVFDSGSSQFLPAEKQAVYFDCLATLLSDRGCLLYQALEATGPEAPSWLHTLGITRARFAELNDERFKPVVPIDRPSRNLVDVTIFGGLFGRI